jgi:hypothetical protein
MDSDDAVGKYCAKQYANYASLYQSCLKDNGNLFIDNAFGD